MVWTSSFSKIHLDTVETIVNYLTDTIIIACKATQSHDVTWRNLRYNQCYGLIRILSVTVNAEVCEADKIHLYMSHSQSYFLLSIKPTNSTYQQADKRQVINPETHYIVSQLAVV